MHHILSQGSKKKKRIACTQGRREPNRAPGLGAKKGPPALKAPKNLLGHAIFLLDHALKFTCKTLLLGGHALLYTVGNIIFDGKSFLISA